MHHSDGVMGWKMRENDTPKQRYLARMTWFRMGREMDESAQNTVLDFNTYQRCTGRI